MKNLLRNKKALSPVIATVILVSVTIVVSVSVAYWLGSIASGYTAFEQIEMPTTYAEQVEDLFGVDPNTTATDGWKVHIDLKNAGSADSTIDNIFINNKPLKDFQTGNITVFKTADDGNGDTIDLTAINVQIPNGESAKIIIWIQKGTEGCTAGTNINVKIHSAAGMEYPDQVKLP